MKYENVWDAVDKLAKKHGLSPSGLAKLAGLDATTFNKSKRLRDDGFVVSRREGRFIIYTITKGVHQTAMSCIHKRYDSLPDKSAF